MTYGIKLFDPSGSCTFSTDQTLAMQRAHHSDGVTASFTPSLASGLSQVMGFSTTTSGASISGSSTTRSFTYTGYGSNLGSPNFNAPGLYLNGTTGYYWTSFPTAANPSSFDVFATRSSAVAGDFGMSVLNGTGNYFDSAYVPLFIQQDASGNKLFSATTSTIPTNLCAGYPTSSFSATLSPTPNVFFPQPLDRPPLIFITSTNGGYISLAGMQQDGNGKWVSASVVCENTNGTTGGGWPGGGNFTYPMNPAPCTFTYFLASDQAPNYGEDTGYGLTIKNPAGTVVMDTRYSMLSIQQTIEVARPYLYANSTYVSCAYGASAGASSTLYTAGASAITVPANTGVCLNPFCFITAWWEYIAAMVCIIDTGGGQVASAGTLKGTFLSIDSSGNGMISMKGAAGWAAGSYGTYGCANFFDPSVNFVTLIGGYQYT